MPGGSGGVAEATVAKFMGGVSTAVRRWPVAPMWTSAPARLVSSVVVVGALLATSLVLVTPPGPASAAEYLSGSPDGPPTEEPTGEAPSSPLEVLRPSIRGAVDDLDTIAASMADLTAERARQAGVVAERRASADDLVRTRRATVAERRRRATQSVERAQERRDRTAEQADRLATQAQRVAMGLYLEGEPILAEGLLPGKNPLSAVVAHETVRAGIRAAIDAHRTVQSRLELLEASLARRVEALARAEEALVAVDVEVAQLEVDASGAEVVVADIDRQLPLFALAASAAQDRIVGLLQLGGSPAHRASDPTLSILGPSQLTAGQLASWLTTPMGGSLEADRASELATAYVEEGAAVGVRGDVAIAQAVLETGGFRFTGSNNFAGIGHCDSCPRGFAYPTLREGVRAQVQLLRAYADPDLDPATLPGGPVAGLGLGGLSVKGCCESWWGLTGVWATALHYGGSILRLYESAVAHASSLPPSD